MEDLARGKDCQVSFSREEAPKPADGVFDSALLPRRPGIAKEGFDSEGFSQAVILVYCSRELAADFDAIMNHLSFFYEHTWEWVGLLSLPFLRLFGIPVIFFLVASSIRRDRLLTLNP